MTDQTQQELLREVKNMLGGTWDEVASKSGINPIALKTYRMPKESKNFRAMNNLAKNALLRLMEDIKMGKSR